MKCICKKRNGYTSLLIFEHLFQSEQNEVTATIRVNLSK